MQNHEYYIYYCISLCICANSSGPVRKTGFSVHILDVKKRPLGNKMRAGMNRIGHVQGIVIYTLYLFSVLYFSSFPSFRSHLFRAFSQPSLSAASVFRKLDRFLLHGNSAERAGHRVGSSRAIRRTLIVCTLHQAHHPRQDVLKTCMWIWYTGLFLETRADFFHVHSQTVQVVQQDGTLSGSGIPLREWTR